MSEKELNKIIADNITRQMELNNRTQLELAEYMNVSQATVSNWCKGVKMPRMSKIDMICKFFDINRSDLMNDSSSQPELNKRDTKQIEEILQQTKDKLTSQEGLMFDDDPASPEAIDSILNAMEIGMEMAKRKNKEKYTPKKYKKDWCEWT